MVQIDLSCKVALVTESTKGIGLATAEGLHAAGAGVIVHGRSPDEVETISARLGGQGIAADIGTAAGCETLSRLRALLIFLSITQAFTRRAISSRWMTVNGIDTGTSMS